MHKAKASNPTTRGFGEMAHLLGVPFVYTLDLRHRSSILYLVLGSYLHTTAHNLVHESTWFWRLRHLYLLSDAEAGIARYRAKASSASRVI